MYPSLPLELLLPEQLVTECARLKLSLLTRQTTYSVRM